MSGRRQYSDKHSLPANPSWVDFVRSDGDENQWPTNTTREVDSQGHVNYMRPVGLDELGVSIKWRIEVGAAMAVLLKWPEGPSYVLREWPKGYRMYDHLKGPHDAPRHDIYLFGSKSRYRSVPEFIPHALWLMEDPTLDRSNCKCKYCSKKTQREITSTMTFLPKTRNTPASNSPGPSRFQKSRIKAHITHKPYAAVQRMPKPLRYQHTGPQNPVLRERNNDLRAACSTSSMKLKRWFREGELLWCCLDQPIRGSKDSVDITFWPGLVQEVKLKTDAIPRKADGPETDVGDDNSSTPWTVRQSTVYKMKLLAVSYSYSISDEKVLPYQAYFPSSDLILALQELSFGSTDLHMNSMTDFNPCPPMSSDPNAPSGSNNGALFVDAVAPYALAVQIGSNLAGFWSLTDEWDFKYAVPPSSTTAATRPEPASLHSVIMAAGLQSTPSNSLVDAGSASSGPSGYRNISGPTNGMSEADLYNLGTRMLGPPTQPAQTVTQMRYQGLWWGAERIWTDELVRLKLARRQLAPEGAPDIYPPAGPSQNTLEYNAQLLGTGDVSQADLGAGGRGVFMKLEGLFVVDTPREDGSGMRKECRASGMLYELADEDWEDPYAEAHEKFALEKEKQKSEAASSFRLSGQDASNANGVPKADTTAPSSSPNDALSHPILSTPYPIPSPPAGFKFRPILTPGHEAVLSLTLISGRYYPHILLHPLLQSAVQRMYTNSLEEGGLHQGNHLWALEGLSPGYFNAVDPTKAKASRIVMMRDADREARTEAVEAFEKAREQKLTEAPDTEMQDQLQPGPMDVDMVALN